MSNVVDNYYSRLEEYEVFQKTNLDYSKSSYHDWMFGRDIKEAEESALPISKKVKEYVKLNLNKALLYLCNGNKEKAMGFKLLMAFSIINLDNTRKEFSNHWIILTTALTVFLCSSYDLLFKLDQRILGLVVNKTIHLE